ncbi:GTPase IMAP family member 8-like [Xyrichtys novacula]|uniref:GTPase IMAP family member 8-like n=1 Tax=Xyrichtys novacula TaxID=13765 RepID=A0AAV1GN67_XYRNO|nr:GTPase IMAP family member 8-like [Xyrichtys novacula]
MIQSHLQIIVVLLADGVTNSYQMMVVSTAEEWFSFKSLLQNCSGDKHLQVTSQGSHQACDLTVDGRSVSLHYAEIKQSMTEEDMSQELDGCFRACADGICTFLLLIQGGHYTKTERGLVEVLQAHFGEEALKFLMVLSLEDGKVADTFDDALLELLQMCEGRYSQITSSAAGDKLRSLLKMVDHMLTENGLTGYTEVMLTEAKTRGMENSSMKILRQKVLEAEENEQAFELMVQQQEERRAKEMEELKAKHAEERQKEAAERKQHEKRKKSSEEAVISHRATLKPQITPTDDDNVKKMSIVLLGLSGSGKTSALNLILERVGNQYLANESSLEPPEPTLSCERQEVLAAGRKLILVDTPELWDEDGFEDLEQVKDCLSLSLPGPQVFLLVLQMGRFTQGECEMLVHLQRIFGREFTEYTIVLFVSFDGSHLRPQRIDDHVAGAHAALQDLIRKCGSRYYELNVTKSHNALNCLQVKDLLTGINKLVASHGGQPYAVRRFSVQELQERRKYMEERKEGALEVNSLLRDS